MQEIIINTHTHTIGLGYSGTEAYKEAVTFCNLIKLYCLGSKKNRCSKFV